MRNWQRISAALMTAIFGAALRADTPAEKPITAKNEVAQLHLVPNGAMKKIGYYRPNQVKLSAEKPAGIKKVADDLTAPLYGSLTIGGQNGQTYYVIVDEPDNKPPRLFVDGNGNGDLTDDKPVDWKKQNGNYFSDVAVKLGSDAHPYEVGLGVYRFDKKDPQRAALKDSLFFYRDYAVEGDAKLGDKTYHVMLIDETASGDFSGQTAGSAVQIFIDRNGNGKIDSRGETYDVRKPFNIGGTTYELADVAKDGLSFRAVKSQQSVAEISLPPDHSAGKIITAFEATRTDGKPVTFPSDYKGKVVMLDFWATWCGPCMGEVPGLVKTYEKYHEKGFDILGISLDFPQTVAKLEPVTKEQKMTWPQVCDGKGWSAAIAQTYVIQSIPAAFLVDGDTGKILASGQELRGESLEKTIEKALASKAGK